MKLKEKCIYYNHKKECYYLVICVSDMIYGRCGDIANSNRLDNWLNQDGKGLMFKIDDIVINSNYIRNYYLDEVELEHMELIKELTDEEFYPMEILILSNYKYPAIIIDVHKHMNGVIGIVNALKYNESEIEKLKKDRLNLERRLFQCMQ